MKSWLIMATGLIGVATWLTAAGAQNAKPPTVKEIMKKVNFRDGALCPLLGRALKVDQPNWDEVQRETHQFATLVDALGQNEPPRGDKASWQQLTKSYIAAAHELDMAAQRKDRNAALAAHAKVANPATCNGCHKVHRN
ncbi:hypothetical protein AYO44_14415 [Planctomycetaceae bacterium SCGC AG-212-F19]|nr:hypothetical protein AYO44_14415 [Planctomycetaceae bacterium SCGC AG-212-F19]